MKPFKTIKSGAVILNVQNVDTDQVIPARFLNKPRTIGLGQFCFYDLLRNPQCPIEMLEPGQIFSADARVLIAGANFGSGSSRENAVWALVNEGGPPETGFCAIIAPSFGDIFYNNACKNGLLPITASVDEVEKILASLQKDRSLRFEINLQDKIVSYGDNVLPFAISDFYRDALLKGLDEIDTTLSQEAKLLEFERSYKKLHPWLERISQ